MTILWINNDTSCPGTYQTLTERTPDLTSFFLATDDIFVSLVIFTHGKCIMLLYEQETQKFNIKETYLLT